MSREIFLVICSLEGRDLVVCVKSWRNEQKLVFSGYFVTVLVIFYLQRMEMLPSVRSLQSEKRMRKSRGSCRVNFSREKEPNNESTSLPMFKREFFAYYAATLMCAGDRCLSPYFGEVINIEMTGPAWTNQNIYVQDIFRRQVNIGANICKADVDRLQQACIDQATQF